jgi:DNA-binding CsgD family transcriptional regulator
MNIPGALLNSSIEIFTANGRVMAITEGATYEWEKIPARVREKLRELLHSDPQALELLQDYSQNERLRIYAKCRFGGFNATPDIDVCGTANSEHWDCSCTDCPLQSHFRNTLAVKNGILSSREIEVAKLIAQGYLGKIISDRLNICESTINTHKRHLFEKVGVSSSVELSRWAYKINLI